MNKNLDLNVDAPEKVARILRAAAQEFHESAGELAQAWTDPNAGKVWTDMARILERAAVSTEKAVAKRMS